MGGPIGAKQQCMTFTFDNTFGLDRLMTKVKFKDLLRSDRGDFRCRRVIDLSRFIVISNYDL